MSLIHHRGEDVEIPMDGKVTKLVKKWVGDIMYGAEDHEWGVVIDETKAWKGE